MVIGRPNEHETGCCAHDLKTLSLILPWFDKAPCRLAFFRMISVVSASAIRARYAACGNAASEAQNYPKLGSLIVLG